MKKLIFTLTILLLAIFSYSQTDHEIYTTQMAKGDSCLTEENYFDAYDNYRKADWFARTNQTKKQAATQKMDFCIAKIKRQQFVSDSLLNISDSLVASAQSMVLTATALQIQDKDQTKAIRLAELAWKIAIYTYPPTRPQYAKRLNKYILQQ